jgi:hypothetical protein
MSEFLKNAINTLVLYSGGREFKSSDEHVFFFYFKVKNFKLV